MEMTEKELREKIDFDTDYADFLIDQGRRLHKQTRRLKDRLKEQEIEAQPDVEVCSLWFEINQILKERLGGTGLVDYDELTDEIQKVVEHEIHKIKR